MLCNVSHFRNHNSSLHTPIYSVVQKAKEEAKSFCGNRTFISNICNLTKEEGQQRVTESGVISESETGYLIVGKSTFNLMS